MKNKILASLLAVCLFAGLAVPAFASTTSSVAGDGSKVTKMEFLKSEYTLKQDEEKDFTKELRVYESDSKLVIDYQQITWELQGQGTNFTLGDGAKVTAVNDTGSTKLIAKDDQSGKVVATTTIKATTNPAKRNATSFKYANQANMQIPVGRYAQDFEFKVNPITTGNYWTNLNEQVVSNQVIADINAALGLDGSAVAAEAGVAANFVVTITTAAANATSVSVPTLSIVDPTTGKPVTVKGAQVAVDAVAADIAAAFTGKEITIGGVTYKATVIGAAITFTAKEKCDVAASEMPAAGATTSITASPALATDGTAPITAPAVGFEERAATAESVIYKGINSDNDLVFVIPGAVLRDERLTLAASDYGPKTSVTTVAAMADRDNKNEKSITAKTNVSYVAAKKYTTIAIAPNKTIAVGETFDLAATLKKGAANANVHGAINSSWTEEYYNDAAVANDYAIVDADGIVLGVAVGKNKISVQLENGAMAYCVIEVVKKGTSTSEAGTVTTVLSNWTPKLGVGETANVVVKAAGAVTYTSLDTAIVTVDAAGKLTAVKEGTAKVKVQEEGKDAVYLTVTVAAATTKPSDKPSDVPQTAVVALAPLF